MISWHGRTWRPLMDIHRCLFFRTLLCIQMQCWPEELFYSFFSYRDFCSYYSPHNGRVPVPAELCWLLSGQGWLGLGLPDPPQEQNALPPTGPPEAGVICLASEEWRVCPSPRFKVMLGHGQGQGSEQAGISCPYTNHMDDFKSPAHPDFSRAPLETGSQSTANSPFWMGLLAVRGAHTWTVMNNSNVRGILPTHVVVTSISCALPKQKRS